MILHSFAVDYLGVWKFCYVRKCNDSLFVVDEVGRVHKEILKGHQYLMIVFKT